MTDDAFRLTAHDIRSQQFTRALRGYDPARVDEFRDRVAEELERLLRDRVQHEERLKSAKEQLSLFQERERAMNEALVAAQQLRADAQRQADRDAEGLLRDARLEAERIIDQARQEERLVRERAEAAARQFAAYLAGFRGLLERQLAELEVLQSHAKTIVEVQASAMNKLPV